MNTPAEPADRPEDAAHNEGNPLGIPNHWMCRCSLPGDDTPLVGRDVTVMTTSGKRRTVLKTIASIRWARDLIMDVFGCPDVLVDDVVAYALGHIDE